MAERKTSEHDPSSVGGGVDPRFVVAGVLAVALAVFVGQNSQRVTVEWLFFDARQPLWLVLILTALVAVGVQHFVVGAIRRRRGKR